ncbi:unnamed protein product [Notodromas monacha]|uniref:Uncharacterized protein n=1 Tax=Notodromas monacha TaxID=399045 RepID=A0A7R9GKA2_9CRUS|nr:unnamed protein product [Notodromas monacha]CAG0924537.1 unnamed protein product [Notodromas monacha]
MSVSGSFNILSPVASSTRTVLAQQNHSDGVQKLKCLNVLPRCSYRTGYENLSHLVKRANNWLRHHKQWEVRTCESLPLQTKAGRNKIAGPVTLTQLSRMRRSAPDTCLANHVTFLRLWVIKCDRPRVHSHKIVVHTVLPKPILGGADGRLEFTDLETLLTDVNSTLEHTWPSNFEILTVETLQTTFDRRPDDSSEATLLTMGLRIFVGFLLGSHEDEEEAGGGEDGSGNNGHEMSHVICEAIGLADFAPRKRPDGTFETFSDLVLRASRKCSSR